MKTFKQYLRSEMGSKDLPWGFPKWIIIVLAFIYGFIKHTGEGSFTPILISTVIWTGGAVGLMFIYYKLSSAKSDDKS